MRKQRNGRELFRRVGALAAFSLIAVAGTIETAGTTLGDTATVPKPAVAASGRSGPAAAPIKLRPGDKLRIVFYERYDDEEDKWRGHTRSPDAGFHQFAELCGDYTVQDDGTVSLPIIGRFPASGNDRDHLLAQLGKGFEDLVGEKGFVNIVSVEHQPVYVVGPVRSPGAFRFVQGMTVLHAVALAGGIKTVETEAWQRVETGREFDRLQRSLEKVKRLLVRTSVLRAEDGAPLPQAAVATLVGRSDMPTLGDEESADRKLTARSRNATDAALVSAVENARADYKARTERLKPLDALIAVREQREQTISQLVDHNTVARPILVQSQSELADVQDRKQQALIEADVARSRVADTERDLTRHRMETGLEVSRSTATAERETVDAVADAQGTLDVIQTLTGKTRSADEAPTTYEVARRTDTGTVVINLAGTAALEPGDLVRLRASDIDRDHP